jgi:hypothetical protein
VADKFDYNDAALTAIGLVNFFGVAGSITRSSSGTINPATGESQSPVNLSLNGTITPILPVKVISEGSVSKTYGSCYWVGGEILTGDYFGNDRVDSINVIKSPDNQILVQELIFNE